MSTQNPPRLAVAAIVKNEAPYLVEWVAFHRALGIGAFFIADNGSDDGTTELLAEMQDAGLARSFAFPHVPGSPPQLPAYREIMRRHRHEADWFAFIDADEFLFPTDAEYSLSRIMAEIDRHQDIGAVAVNWAIFGSAGHKLPSDELVIERFDKRAAQDFPVNAHCKTILRATAWAGTGGTPHTFPLAPGFRYSRPKVEDEISSQKEGSVDPISWERLRLNHYVVKSEEEFFRRKLPKGRADAVGRERTAAFFRGHDRNEVHEPIPADILLRTKMSIDTVNRAAASVLPASPSERRKKIAIAAIVKNEKAYILEWIAYHRLIGVEEFYIADNGSTDGTRELLSQLQECGIVKLLDYPGTPNSPPQLSSYAELMRLFGNRSEWIAFIDADEFIFPIESESIIKFLDKMAVDDSVGAVAINWANFGSGGIDAYIDEPVTMRFQRRAEQSYRENHHYKSIIRTQAYLRTHGNPHLFVLKDGWRMVDAVGRPVQDHERGPGLSSLVVWENVRLNHYVVKSKEEFFNKKAKNGSATTVGRVKGESYFSHHDRNEEFEPPPNWLRQKLPSEIASLSTKVGFDVARKGPLGVLTVKNESKAKVMKKLVSMRGAVDRVIASGDFVTVAGWAITQDGHSITAFRLGLGDEFAIPGSLTRRQRPDVVRHFPDADLECGFEILVPVSSIPNDLRNSEKVRIYGESSSSDVQLVLHSEKMLPVEGVVKSTDKIPHAVPRASSLGTQSENIWYPTLLAVGPEGSTPTQRFIETAYTADKKFTYAEFGVYRGATAEFVATRFPNAELHLFDFNNIIEAVSPRFEKFGRRINWHGCTQKYNDSYNWNLIELIRKRDGLVFDYCFLDGAHTFAIDALTYFLCDSMMPRGAYIDFDDYDWRLRGSSLDPSRVPETAQQYTDQQIDAYQVAMIVDDLVRPSGRFREVVKNRVFRKTSEF